jgi:hypothetical protein
MVGVEIVCVVMVARRIAGGRGRMGVWRTRDGVMDVPCGVG